MAALGKKPPNHMTSSDAMITAIDRSVKPLPWSTTWAAATQPAVIDDSTALSAVTILASLSPEA